MTLNPIPALRAAKKITKGYGGQCLAFVRTAYGVPSKYASAWEAWEHSRMQVKATTLDGVPRGAAVFFAPKGSPYGHVAIYAGNGQMITSDSATNKVGSQSVALWQRAGWKLVGWSLDLNGQCIAGIIGHNYKIGAAGTRVRYAQAHLIAAGHPLTLDGIYGTATRAAVTAYQRKNGLKPTGTTTRATRKLLNKER